MANKQYYRTLIEGKRECCFLADFEGDILLINSEFEKFTGYNEAEITEISVRNLFFTLSGISNPMDTRQFSEFNDDFYLLGSTNYLIPVELEFKEIEGQKFLGIIRESKIDKKESTQEVSPKSILQPLSAADNSTGLPNTTFWNKDQQHFLRTTLNGILGFGSILLQEEMIQNDSRISAYVSGIVKNSIELKSILDVSNDSGRLSSIGVSMESVDIGLLLQKIKILLNNQAKVQNIDFEIKQTRNFTFLTNEDRLNKVLLYLIQKALKFSRSHSVIIEVKIDEISGMLLIIIDNIGMDIPLNIINLIKRENLLPAYDFKNKLFDDAPELAGLLNNINLLEGKVFFNTGEHYGEIVTLAFSMSKAVSVKDLEVSLETQIKQKNIKILLVEDDKINVKVLNVFLKGIAEVLVAYSGNEALNFIEMYYSKGLLFNLVLMDIGLPEPLDGIRLKHEIENRWPEYINIPFIAQTAYAQDSLADNIINGNFKGILIKPLDKLDLLRVILKSL